MLAVLVKTFIREEKLRRCVDSIFQYIDVPFRLYIADDSDTFSEKQVEFYHKLRNEGHKIIILPYNSGLPAGRNAMIDALEDEEYVMVLDDDIYVQPDTDVRIPLDIIQGNKNIKLVGGALPGRLGSAEADWHLRLHLSKTGILYKIPAPEPGENWHETNGHKWIDCDDVLNFFIAERSIFDKVRWNNLLKFREHMNFFWAMRLKYPGGVAYAPDFVADHIPEGADPAPELSEEKRIKYEAIRLENRREGDRHRFDEFPEIKAVMRGFTTRDRIAMIERRPDLHSVPWIDWYE